MVMFNPPGLTDILKVNNGAGGLSITGFGAAFTGTAGTTLVISTPNSTGTAAGTDIQLQAGNASTSGAGGNVILLPGNNAGGGTSTGTVQISTPSGGVVGQLSSSGAGIFSISPFGGITNIEFSILGATAAVSFNVSMVTSSVNYIQVAGATSGNHPIISCQGTITDGNITLTPKGAGDVDITTGGLKISAGRIQKIQGADVASGTNLTLLEGNTFEITGTTQIDLILITGWQNGSEVTLIFNESLTVRHGIATSGSNVTILLSGGANFSATANDTLTLVLSETTAGGQAWREVARTAI